MKRTHLSTGLYFAGYVGLASLYPGRRKRMKHTTLCGSICDYTKATEAREAVTCRLCRKKMGRP